MDAQRGMQQSSGKQWVAGLAAASIMFHPTIDVIWAFSPDTESSGPGESVQNIVLAILGAIVGAVLADIFGRKRTLLVTLIFTIPRLLWVIFEDASWMWILRIFIQFASGITCTVVPLYISEIARTNNRKNLLILQPLLTITGLFAAVAVVLIPNHYGLSLTVSTIISSLLLVISTLFHGIILAVFPETPQYLNSKKNYQEAAKALAFYRGTTHLKIQETGIELPVNSYSNNRKQGCVGKITEMMRFENRRSLAIIFSLIAIRWTSGQHRNSIIFFSWASNYGGDEFIAAYLGVFCAEIIYVAIIIFAISIFVRKVSLLLVIFGSFVVAIISMTNLVGYTWVHFALLVLQNFGNFILTCVTLAYTGEFFPINVRAIAIAVIISFEMLVRNVFVLSENKIFDKTFIIIHTHQSAYLSAGALFSAFVFVLIFFPKTNKVPSSEIAIETSAGTQYLL